MKQLFISTSFTLFFSVFLLCRPEAQVKDTPQGVNLYAKIEDGMPASEVRLGGLSAVTASADGSYFILCESDGKHYPKHNIYKVDPKGIISAVAGTENKAKGGEGGSAKAAILKDPKSMAVDAAGNLYITDAGNHRILKVDTKGIITTVAGTGTAGFNGDGIMATAARLNFPVGLALDGSGNLFFTDANNHRIRKIDAKGKISTLAGTGTEGYSGDGGAATAADLSNPTALAADASGNLFFLDISTKIIRKVDASSGIITRVAGAEHDGFRGDGGAASAAGFVFPVSLAVDKRGNLYVADYLNHRVRMINASGTISTVAGTDHDGFSGDGGAASKAHLAHPASVAVDGLGNLFIADAHNLRIRKVNKAGIISTVAGSGTYGYHGDGLKATEINIDHLQDVATDAAGNLYLVDQNSHRIRKVDSSGIISTVAGSDGYGSLQDGISALSAALQKPVSVAVDGFGNFYIASEHEDRIRKVDSSGTITTLAGTDTKGYEGDGKAAIAAQLNSPSAMVADGLGNLYISDKGNHCIRKVDTKGIITTVAGTGAAGFSGDGKSATSAQLHSPEGLGLDSSGNLYVCDKGNHRIRKIDASGIITTVAGTGTEGFHGNGGPASAAQLYSPHDLVLDKFGNLFIADTYNDMIRKVDSAGIITTVAGLPGLSMQRFNGDDIEAAAARLSYPQGLATDSQGNLYIADTGNNRIRKVDTKGIITTVAGNGYKYPSH